MQGVEAALMQGLSVLTSAGQPSDDGRLPVAEDPFGPLASAESTLAS